MAGDTNYLNIDGEISTTPIGYNSLLTKDNTEILNTDANFDATTDATESAGISNGINSGNSDAIIGSGAVTFDQTTLQRLSPNEDIKTSNFLSGSLGWRIQGNGNVEFNNGIFRGDITGATGTFTGGITATSGSIGSWYINTNTISSAATEAASGILLDRANSLIRVGASTGNYITIDGANLCLQSSNYAAGVSGFKISPTLVEAENLIGRGIMRGSTFAYDIISAIGGQMMVASADVLDEDMTALDASTLKTKGTVTFAVNDIIVIRNVATSGIVEEWLRVTSIASAPTYSVTRDLASSYSANSNPIWKAGTPVVKQGSSDGASTYSGGWLRLLGEGTNSPHYSVYNRTGVAYNSSTEIVRIGNLNGFLDYVTNLYGIAIGESSKYLKYDTTNGLRVAGTINSINFFTAGIALTAGQAVCMYTDGKVYSTDALVSSMTSTFIGFCYVTTAKDSSCPVMMVGDYSGLTGLTVGSNYYLSNATYTVDQEQTSHNNDVAIGTTETQWQSFTTGSSVTHISKVVVQLDGGAVDKLVTVRIREGEGLAGTLVGTKAQNVPAQGSITFYFDSPLPVSGSTKYSLTFQIDVLSFTLNELTTSDAYAGGRNDNNSAYDYRFATYYTTGRGAIGTSAGTNSKKCGMALASTELLILNS